MLEVLNRRGFDRELTRSLAFVKRYGTPAVLMYIDLDGFKAVNDRHGHGAGDALLKAVVAELVATCAPPTWSVVSAATNSGRCCGTCSRRRRRQKRRASN